MYKISTLSDGITVITGTQPQSHSVGLGVWLKIGSRYEQAAHQGISHFLEHLVFKGTRRRSYRDIKEAIEGRGGILNAFTGEEATCFFAKIVPQQAETALDILLDMALNPLLRSGDIKKERQVICEEIKMYQDVPQHVLSERCMELLWPEHPLGRSIAGTLSSMAAIGPAAVRDYYRVAYQPQRLMVIACGALSHARLLKLVRVSISRNGGRTGAASGCGYEPAPRQYVPQVALMQKQTEQTHVCLGFHAIAQEHPARHALSLLHILLGANMSSRLFNEVRERKGLAYEIGTGVKRFVDCGAFIVQAGVRHENLLAGLTVTLRELRKISRYLVSAAELERAKQYYSGQLLMMLEDSSEHMIWLGDRVVAGAKIKTAARVIADMRTVSAADIRALARLLLTPQRLNLAVLGPLPEQQAREVQRLLKDWY